MRKDYRSASKTMTDQQLLAEIAFHLKYLNNDELGRGTTSHLTKMTYFEHVARKRSLLDA